MALFDIIDDIAEKQITKTETGDNRIMGVMVGTVVNNYDMNMPGRVCVSIPVRDKEANELKWARVAMPSSGMNWGHYFLPEVGDQVLLVFDQGNIEKPYVIGCVPKDMSIFLRKSVDMLNKNKRIVTKNGNSILFEDNVEGEGMTDRMVIETAKSMHSIEMNNAKNMITIKDLAGANQIEMKTGTGQMEIKAASKLTIKVGETIELTMNGMTGATTLKTNRFTMEANESVKLDANANMEVRGGTVAVNAASVAKINSSGAVVVSGTPIKVG